MPIICLCGLHGSGKGAIASELVKNHGFTLVKLQNSLKTSIVTIPETCDNIIEFQTTDQAVDELTSNWRGNYVIADLMDYASYEAFLKRPFFVIVEVVAPCTVRYNRVTLNSPAITMLELVQCDDDLLFGPVNLHGILRHAKVCITNDSNDPAILYSAIARMHLEDDDKWIRPSWDVYFMEMAELASKRSNCMKRVVGAVLVKDRRVVATGYNGTARGLVNCRDGGCVRCNGNARCGVGLEHCFCLHAEENALLEAGRARSEGSTLYCTTAPCLGCSQKIIQCGVIRVVYAREYSLEHNALALMNTVGVQLVKYVEDVPLIVR